MGHKVDMNSLFMVRQLKSRTLGWTLSIGSLEGPLEPAADTIVEDIHVQFFRWGKNTRNMQKEIDAHADRIAHSGVWEEPTTLIDTRVFG